GEYVTLTVSDSGIGMPEEIQAKIFDPFFTTKEAGKGSGLGLAVVRGIVEQTGGHITLYSEVGRGTTFKIFFPRYARDVQQLRSVDVQQLRSVSQAQAQAPARGSETILLVEDEYLVRIVLKEAMEEHGYTVLEAGGGKSALELIASHRGPIHLLITD